MEKYLQIINDFISNHKTILGVIILLIGSLGVYDNIRAERRCHSLLEVLEELGRRGYGVEQETGETKENPAPGIYKRSLFPVPGDDDNRTILQIVGPAPTFWQGVWGRLDLEKILNWLSNLVNILVGIMMLTNRRKEHAP